MYPYWESSYFVHHTPYVIWNPPSAFPMARNYRISKAEVDLKSYMRLL